MRRSSSLAAGVAALIAALVAATAWIVVTGPPAAAATTIFAPSADTYVYSSNPSTNYGGSSQLQVDGSPAKRLFVRFDINGLAGTVTSATLRIRTADVSGAESSSGGTFRAMSNTTWSESSVTWNNQPAIDGATLGSLGSVARNTWYDVDVTAAVTGDGAVSFGVTSSSSNGADYDSRESGADIPQLVITTSEEPPPPSEVTFTPSADTYVYSSNSSTNYGGSSQLQVDGSPAKRLFVRFDVSGLAGTVTGATLRIRTADASGAQSNNGGTFQAMSNTAWSESSVTWNNQPAIDGATLGSLGSVSRNTWYEIDVTAAVSGNGAVSFGATSASNNGADYDSRESGADAPQLVVVTSGGSPSPSPTGSPTPSPTPTGGDPVLVGAGDIAGCSGSGDEATADLLDNIPGIVFTAGDNAYPDGTTSDFNNCYDPSWGRHKDRTRPAPGNHDYYASGAAPYFAYFGANAGDPDKGYYSYDLGNWHVVAINSNCSDIGGCGAGSAQEQWLRADLAASTQPCTAAYWHHPLFTSGSHSPSTSMRPIFQALYDYAAEVVIAGHNHQYERFAPQDPFGNLDTANGIRHFVAGMGGRSHYGFGSIEPNSEARNGDTYGVLKLTLKANGYDWEFVPEAGKSYTDSGSGTCH